MKKNSYKVLGVMSGTSLDGIDVVYVELSRSESWKYRVISAETIEYSDSWQKKLGGAVDCQGEDLVELNIDYTQYLAGVISSFIRNHGITNLDAVCSHGHTVKHAPENGYTLQIGNLPELAVLLDEVVVCDFRVADVKLGGQGAPLVPVGDALLFGEYDVCLNLGGFANVSSGGESHRTAYDICPVNTVLNHLSGQLGLPFDKGGQIAASGEIDVDLLKRLNGLDYYAAPPPKSLGIEWVKEHVFPLLRNVETPAGLMTFSVHAAEQISKKIDQDPSSKVLVTGGGAFNDFLIKEIRSRIHNKLVIPSPEVVNYKEALIFGLLGVLKLRGEINVLCSVTGASKDHSSGEIYVP